MAIELDPSKLKSGDSLYFKAAGRFPFWTPERGSLVMDRIWQDVLEGKAHTHGFAPYIYTRTWATDADDAIINASKTGDLAGAYLGETITDSSGQIWLKVDFPFTFYNRDGSNHDQKSTIIAWVKIQDVEIKEDMETRLKNLIGEDPFKKDLVGNKDGKDKKTNSTLALLIAFFVAIGTGLYFWDKKKKAKKALAYQQQISQSSLLQPFRKNIRL